MFFEPKFNATGSNKYIVGCETLASWNYVFVEVEEEGKLPLLLQFATRLESPPAMSFDKPCQLLFEHSNTLSGLTQLHYTPTHSVTLTLTALEEFNLLKIIIYNGLSLGKFFTDFIL